MRSKFVVINIRMFVLILINIIIFFFISCDSNPFFGMGEETDVKPPSISISSPANTEFVGANFHVKGKASDDKGLASITLYVEGTSYSKEIKSNLTDWDIQVDTTNIESKSYRIKVVAKDKSGKSTSAYVNITLDKDGPAINVYSPELTSDVNVSTQLAGIINFIVYPVDKTGVSKNSLNNKLTIYKRGTTTVIYSTVISFDSVNNRYETITIDTLDYEEQDADLLITFEDDLGNISEFRRKIQLKHDENTPSININSPEENATIPKWLTIAGYATDNKEISKVCWNIMRQDSSHVYSTFREIIPDTPRSYFNFSKTIEVDNLPDGGGSLSSGSYWLLLYALDNENNNSETKKVKFNVDTTLPIITILDSTTTPTGDTPAIAAYLNSNFDTDVKCSTPSLDYMRYKITQNISTPKDTGWNPFGSLDNSGDIYSITININTLKTTHGFTDGLITVIWEAKKGTKISNNSRIFYLDTTPPTVDILSHNNNDSVNGAVTLSGSAYDALGLEGAIKVYRPLPFDNTVDATGQSIWSYVLSTDSNLIETQFGVPDDSSADKTFRITAFDKAGNKKSVNLTLSIDPTKDKPSITLLIPSSSGRKVSGMMPVLAVMSDDDYPAKTMSATFRVYKMPDNTLVSSLSKDYSPSSSGFPNLSTTIDTTTLIDGTTYRMKFNGTDWHGKQANEVVCDFIVDKNVPTITLSQPANNDYKDTTITFAGTVHDNNLIDSLYLSYLHSDGNNRNIEVTLTPSTPFVPGDYNYTFNCTMNSTTGGSGFVGSDGIDWSNDEWGNSPHLFTLRVTDETGLTGYAYRMINLDNNTPTVAITQPTAGYIIGYGSADLDIKGSINDNPPAGSAYSLGLDKYKIMLYKGGSPYDGAVTSGDGGVIKDYGSTANSSGTASSWTTKWTYNPSLSDANDYQLRVWAKDNMNHESVVATVNIQKNANPPFVNSATVVNPKSYYKGNIQIQVSAQDSGSAPANGIKQLDLIINNTIVDTYSPPGNPLSVNYTFTYATDSTSDGLKEVKVRVTDINTESTDTKLVGNLVFDNTKPVISAPQFYTLGYSNPITGYSTYLGFTVEVNDVYSLAGDNPQFKIGTTSGGSEVLDWSYFPTITWDGQNRYIATFDNWIDVSSYSTRLYLTIKSTDSAGNIETNTSYHIDQASGIPTVTLTGATDSFKSDKLDSNPGDGKTEIAGTVSVSGQDKIWIRVGTGAEVEVSNYSGGTSFSHLFNNTDLPNDNLKFRVRTSKNGVQKMIEKTFYIDNAAPTVTISSTVTAKSGEGYVSGNNLSGKVIFSGTYTDNYQNRITNKGDIQLQINIDNQGWQNIPTANIITNPYPTAWTWSYEYDTETHPDMVKNNITIKVRATDLGANLTESSSITKNIVPYITELEAINQDASGNSATRPVYEAKWYSGGIWANHNKRRWTVGQDTRFKIKGYNLKQGSTAPEVYLGSFSMPITSSSKNEIVVRMDSNDADNKSGNLYVRAKPSNIDSSTITLYVFKFARIGNDYDTLDAKSFDIDLMTDGKAFVTFTRDHQVPPYYAKPGDGNFSSDDYSTYRIKEATSYNNSAANGYNNGGRVDPAFYTCVALYGNYSYMGTCIDEWTGSPGTVIKWTLLNDTVNYHDKEGGGNWAGSRLINSNINTHKNGRISIRQTGGGNGYIYYFIFDDDSRAASPVKKVRLASITLSAYTTLTQSQFAVVDNTNNPSDSLSMALKSTGHPIMFYHTSGNNSLNIAYNTTTYTPNTFTKRVVKSNGGKFNNVAINTNLILLAYQNSANSLEVGSLTNETDTTLSTLVIEDGSNEGITGVQTSVAFGTSTAFITYLNNVFLNTTKGIRLAYFSGASFTEANLVNSTYWQYMIIPSPVALNYERTVVKWDGTKPVIAYKGNNYIYVVRLIQ